jgi:hypothetical protein
MSKRELRMLEVVLVMMVRLLNPLQYSFVIGQLQLNSMWKLEKNQGYYLKETYFIKASTGSFSYLNIFFIQTRSTKMRKLHN